MSKITISVDPVIVTLNWYGTVQAARIESLVDPELSRKAAKIMLPYRFTLKVPAADDKEAVRDCTLVVQTIGGNDLSDSLKTFYARIKGQGVEILLEQWVKHSVPPALANYAAENRLSYRFENLNVAKMEWEGFLRTAKKQTCLPCEFSVNVYPAENPKFRKVRAKIWNCDDGKDVSSFEGIFEAVNTRYSGWVRELIGLIWEKRV